MCTNNKKYILKIISVENHEKKKFNCGKMLEAPYPVKLSPPLTVPELLRRNVLPLLALILREGVC